ncbi:hypothetical protein M501DRAFT_1017860 [Patellaria atrata CBS 101060]|uniref:BTB domain-containing protein n=1 Tax=Patellaria atrata CBS 101060 TaxID=1346257 RepID=A0A9P4VN88_9PEZI|nr:hypothetical protein M501DRAFT_1017860 [Patellaria atrata CBS 101060]
MSGYLWKYYLEDDVDSFRKLLETASYNVKPGASKNVGSGHGSNVGFALGSPGSLGTSPTLSSKGKRPVLGSAVGYNLTLTRTDVNWKDSNGLTILHHVASSTAHSAHGFAAALLEHALVDIYIQDLENGWTPLHRAFYAGNISIARLILNRDAHNTLSRSSGQNLGGLIKIKDKEGNGPFDLYALTIKDRTLHPESSSGQDTESSEDDDNGSHGDSGEADGGPAFKLSAQTFADHQGDEVFTFGSNKNITLGFGDEDDRQHPERVQLRRPEHLIQRFYRQYKKSQSRMLSSYGHNADQGDWEIQQTLASLPTGIRHKSLIIQDVQLSKLHTAILTTDPVSNLYMCGHGPGGRLGLGHERTQFQFACIEGGGLAGKKVASIALGQNHSLAITDDGKVYSWGSNGFGQLGYAPSKSMGDEEPVQNLPKQIFGPLKGKTALGAAASRVHSVVHTNSELYTFGKNEGQLGLVSSDARSLEVQITPLRVAASLFSVSIKSVSAIDRATICLLENHDVWVFANYGYARLAFPLEGFSNYFLRNSFLTTKYDTTPNRICKITAGGDTICAMSTAGEVFTVAVSNRTEPGSDSSASTTNPTKIKGALSQPCRLWSLRKGHMAARDVDVDQDGSIILTTEVGTVWRRTKRAKIKDASAAGTSDYRPKDYKFSRVPCLTRVVAVRASSFGAYAVIRKDCDVTRTQIDLNDPSLWHDLLPLFPLKEIWLAEEGCDAENAVPIFWKKPQYIETFKTRILGSKDAEKLIHGVLQSLAHEDNSIFDVEICTNVSDLRIPVHGFILSARSSIARQGLNQLRRGGTFSVIELLEGDVEPSGKISIKFQGIDILTVVDFVLYLYTDEVVDFWHHTRQHPKSAYRYRQIRSELMKIASRLEMRQFEPAVRQMVQPTKSLNIDMELAIREPDYLANGDVLIELADAEVLVHSALICQRCPFFQGLFGGRAGGRWLAQRREELEEPSDAIRVDLKHLRSDVFTVVLRHLYADTGEEIFAETVSDDLDHFIDKIVDVMAVANELLLDRLSQICQRVIGQYVNVRNVCQLLNAVSPSSVTEFKDAGLEYICLCLEAIMLNGSLDELDEDLIYELDEVVRSNQLACLPFVRSGRAEMLLHERNPDLAERIDRGRQAKIDSIKLLSKYADTDNRVSSSFKAHSLDEFASSPSQIKARRKGATEPVSPLVHPALSSRTSIGDLMFEMDDDNINDGVELSPSNLGLQGLNSPDSNYQTNLDNVPPFPLLDNQRNHPGAPESELDKHSDVISTQPSTTTPSKQSAGPWASTPLQSTKLDMKEIMSQASASRTSNISLGLSAQTKEQRAGPSFLTKVSQKERKRSQQGQPSFFANTPSPASSVPKQSPWQNVSRQKSSPTAPPVKSTPSPQTQPSRTPSTPHLTMRQTIANNGPKSKPTPSPGPQSPPQQRRSVSATQPSTQPSLTPSQQPKPALPQAARPTSSSGPSSQPKIQSIRHTPAPRPPESEFAYQLSMADILSQQQMEKDIIKEARESKRSLQDIQQEQEFQEWWDKESRKVMEEEERERNKATGVEPGKGRRRGVRGRGAGVAGDGGRKGKDEVGVKEKPKQDGDAPNKAGSERGGRGNGSRGRGGRNGQSGRGKVRG